MTPEQKIPTAAVETPEVVDAFKEWRRHTRRVAEALAPILPEPTPARESFVIDQGNGLTCTVYGQELEPPQLPIEEEPRDAARRLLEMIRKRVGRKVYDAEVDRLSARSPEFRAAVLALVQNAPPRPRLDLKAAAAYHRATRFKRPRHLR